MQNQKRPLIILTGPTAVGKTELSIELAKACNGEIISADSMQVYRQMDIGTAKIKPEEMNGIKHYMIDEFDPDDDFNVFVFQQKVKEYMEQIYQKGKIPIIVGGTGFYIQAILYDIDFTEEKNDQSYRECLQKEAEEKGVEYIYDMLQKVDPEYASTLHANNVKRVIRALEYYHFTGEKFSVHNERESKKESPYNFAYFVLTMDRETLYKRIDLRVDLMIQDGLVEEVDKLLKQGYSKNLVSMQGLGYKEIVPYIEHKISLEDAVYDLKKSTRHFAKRQLTWFKRERDVIYKDKREFGDSQELLNSCLEDIRKKDIM